MEHPHQRLDQARLYLVCDERADPFLEAVLRGGVDMVQLRMKEAPDHTVRSAAARYKHLCDAYGALFIVNDRPDLAAQCDADGVHLGQDDTPVKKARSMIGEGRLIGLSTHSEAQIEAARGVDYIAVGPVHRTPTKPGREAVGLELVAYAARQASVPWFAIGGIDCGNVSSVREAGANRIAVVRALTESENPEVTARTLRDAVASGRETVGSP